MLEKELIEFIRDGFSYLLLLTDINNYFHDILYKKQQFLHTIMVHYLQSNYYKYFRYLGILIFNLNYL